MGKVKQGGLEFPDESSKNAFAEGLRAPLSARIDDFIIGDLGALMDPAVHRYSPVRVSLQLRLRQLQGLKEAALTMTPDSAVKVGNTVLGILAIMQEHNQATAASETPALLEEHPVDAQPPAVEQASAAVDPSQ